MVRRLKRKGSFTSTNQHNLIHVYVWVAVRYDIFLSPQSDGERFIIILQCWDLSLAPINTTSFGRAWVSPTLAGLHCGSVYVCLFACLLVWCSQTDVTYISQPIVGWGKKGYHRSAMLLVRLPSHQYCELKVLLACLLACVVQSDHSWMGKEGLSSFCNANGQIAIT